ncbi:hypothetical protein VTH06DRAFT_8635 [Thermothelomyces fergusii]
MPCSYSWENESHTSRKWCLDAAQQHQLTPHASYIPDHGVFDCPGTGRRGGGGFAFQASTPFPLPRPSFFSSFLLPSPIPVCSKLYWFVSAKKREVIKMSQQQQQQQQVTTDRVTASRLAAME